MAIKYVCDLTDLEAPAGDNEDFDLPEGWIEVTVRRVIENPEYAAAMDEYEQKRAQMEATVRANAEAQGAQPTDDEIEQAIAVVLDEPEVEEFVVQEKTLHVSVDGAAEVLKVLGL